VVEENEENTVVIVKIVTFEDEQLADDVGHLIATKGGRNIIKRLLEKPYYKQELANKEKQSFAKTEYHLHRIKRAHLAEYLQKPIVKKGDKHEFISIKKQLIIIALNYTREELEKPGALKKLFKNTIKFTVIPIATFLLSNSMQVTNPDMLLPPGVDAPTIDLFLSVAISSCIIISFFVGEKIVKILKRFSRWQFSQKIKKFTDLERKKEEAS